MSKRDFFIDQARMVHGDKYDYSKVELFGGDNGFKMRLTLDIKKNEHCLSNGVKLLYVVGDESLLNVNNGIYQGIYRGDNMVKISDL